MTRRDLDTILEKGAREEIYLNREDADLGHCFFQPEKCLLCGGPLERRHAGSWSFARRQALICVPCDVAWLWFEPPCI